MGNRNACVLRIPCHTGRRYSLIADIKGVLQVSPTRHRMAGFLIGKSMPIPMMPIISCMLASSFVRVTELPKGLKMY
jgi:hypothetical protein